MKLCSYTLCMYLYQYPSLQYMDISAATHCLHKKHLITSKKYRIYLRIWYHRTLFAVNKVFLLCIVSNCIFIVFFFLHIRFYCLPFLPSAHLFRRSVSVRVFLCHLYYSDAVSHAANFPRQRSIGQYFLFL